jgi:hypothetical protein
MGEERNRLGKFIKMHLYPESAQAHLPYFEWFYLDELSEHHLHIGSHIGFRDLSSEVFHSESWGIPLHHCMTRDGL